MEDYKNLIPPRYWNVSYEKDIYPELKERVMFYLKKEKGMGLYIHGDTGVGKTFLACALAKYLNEKMRVKFYVVGELLDKIRFEYDQKQGEEEKENLFEELMDYNKGFLILDDLGAEKLTEWARERLYLLINKKYNDMTPVIFTSNCSLDTLQDMIGDRIVSRIIGMCGVIKITGVDNRVPQNMNIQSNETNK